MLCDVYIYIYFFLYLADPDEDRGCSTNTALIRSLITLLFFLSCLPLSFHQLILETSENVKYNASSPKIDHVPNVQNILSPEFFLLFICGFKDTVRVRFHLVFIRHIQDYHKKVIFARILLSTDWQPCPRDQCLGVLERDRQSQQKQIYILKNTLIANILKKQKHFKASKGAHLFHMCNQQ